MSRDPVVIEQAEVTGWQSVPKRSVLEDTPLRKELLVRHPALRGDHQIVTPMAKDMYRALKVAVLLAQPGTYFTGAPGEGRSSALRACAHLLEHEYSHIVTYQHVSTEMGIFNEKVALQDMLTSAGHAVLTGSPIMLRERLVGKILDDLRRRGIGHTALWCVDNAHNMQRRELEVLADLQHRLWDNGMELLTVMMADPSPLPRSARGTACSGSDLSRRFFGHEHPLRGLCKPGDVTDILDAFDSLDFPEGTEVRWTEFFLPLAYQHGLRLAQEGPALYEAMVQCSPHADKSPATLATLFGAVRRALLRNAGADGAHFRFNPDEWRRAVGTAQARADYVPPRLYGNSP
ncbi:hypothetical protein LMG32289_00927 [Cupriavidus pampae]|uniref:ATP-binding protein n=1 Tax=Cupriavidus pampae TaxID=659251 RepID=A0ABN7XYB7_9BURK|nr:hypothetical protein LMG32289_00927 [Cupriavidus pampae]